MNNLEKYLDQVIEQKPAAYEPPGEIQRPPGEVQRPPEEPPTINLLASVRRRWYLVLVATIVICAVALPAIWLLVEPQYVVQGAVEVRSVVPGILTESSLAGDLSGGDAFINTQATMLTSNNALLQDVADELAGRNLTFLSGTPQSRIERVIAMVSPTKRHLGPERILRDAIAEKVITATALPRTDLIGVAMRSANAEEAKTIVNQFLHTCALRFGSKDRKEEDDHFTLLTGQIDRQAATIKSKRGQINEVAEPYGTTSLAPLEAMKLNVQARLVGEMINLESQKVSAQTNVDLLKTTHQPELPSEQVVRQRREYVNSDPMVAELSRTIVSMERDLITQQALIKEHPRLAQEQTALENLKTRLAAKCKEIEDEYDKRLQVQQKEAGDQRLAAAEMQLAQIDAHYKALSERVNQQDTQAQKVGRAHKDIEDLKAQVQVDQDQYDTLYRRLKALEMDMRRTQLAPRIDVAYEADVVETKDRRVQLATAAVIGALACGFGLAFLRDRMDKTLQTPEDVTRQLDLPVLGTTTSSRTIKPALFAEQIAGDYQTIRTNLGLMNDGGLPRRLVVSSAGTREGKTTFAVNLATSLAKSGKKVLLIDGDLRKPDVGQMLNVPKDTGYLQDVLLGGDSSGIYVSPSSGLHVLAANPRHMADPYELLTSSMAAEQIERLTREYDHIIIDSPPALAFPDALVWAKLADAVVLVGLAGQTTAPDLKEAKERFTRGRARVLGAVLSNVPVDQSLYRHAYTYRARSTALGRKTRKSKKLLLASQKPGDNGGTA
ncbi:MAG: polysaccharide biosynthesis tyrosine autokinase [Phycisphaerae bacterium]|nr:polysaccharide biosynthesis tyrosine autokinase [Phycisphaerae bacterium]